ncbi:hypothetical protein CL631_03275 [bacterium]|nr:hypothetical protein [bacterium]|tara:strand:+ start:1816 stop:3246 length:1431 start_codon:yes stop_codon:yes gene_type:complete
MGQGLTKQDSLKLKWQFQFNPTVDDSGDTLTKPGPLPPSDDEQVVIDSALKSLYGPISEYTDAETLYDAFASTYGAGKTSYDRNLTGFDPQDYASEQGYGSIRRRARSVRGATYGEEPLNLLPSIANKRNRMIQFTGGRIPGYEGFSKYMEGATGKAPDAFADYWYDLAYQEELMDRINIGWETQGVGLSQRPLVMPSIDSYLSELKKLVPDDDQRDVILGDVEKSAYIRAKSLSADYKKNLIEEHITPSIEAVQQRQDVLSYEKDKESTLESIEDLNKMIRAKKRLERTKASLNKVSPTNSTTSSRSIVDKIEDLVLPGNRLQRAVDEDAKRQLEQLAVEKGQKKKAPRNKGLPAEIVDTGIPNFSGVQTIKVHEDIADSLDKAMNELDSQGVALQIEDSFRYRTVQAEQYEASKGGVKAGLVAHPDESYHVKGLAFDLAQTKEMRDDPRVADALTNAGFVRPRDDEWWHWSIQE